ncbi:hypothetical protein K402DRAFT_455287 [Aulographum hederae CBS 113979]|uniref:TAFII28-like protein domain-containing protein n=1 Tax=Aulographum hederae CBS 113979 TaxID=1176131 RepID=A0A6G1GX69_9PEZI|nr:hypothetical protein K402DRAFT_455287 [Aulographum hederae CBS 113979]
MSNNPTSPAHLASNFQRRKSTLPQVHSRLRQASFPPDVANNAIAELGSVASPSPVPGSRAMSQNRSPSVDTATPSLIGGSSNRKRQKRKADQVDGRSFAGSSATNKRLRGASGSLIGASTQEVEDADEPEDEAEVGGEEAGGDMDEETKQAGMRRGVFVTALSGDSLHRYEAYTQTRLNKSAIRKLTNHVLSQSLPPQVLTVVSGMTKVYIQDIIERARQVQIEWMAAGDPDRIQFPDEEQKPVPDSLPASSDNTVSMKTEPLSPDAMAPGLEAVEDGLNADFLDTKQEANEDINDMNGAQKEEAPAQINRDEAIYNRIQNSIKMMDRGALLPEHLQEAVRRYKRDRVGQGTGYMGLSTEGKERASVRTSGRKLFR